MVAYKPPTLPTNKMSAPYSPIIHTSRLTLTTLDLTKDIDFVYELFKTEFGAFATPEKPYTPQTVLKFLNNTQERHQQVAPADLSPAFYLVSLKASETEAGQSTPIGIGFFFVRKAGLPGEMAGYALPVYQKKGYAREAGKALIDELKGKGVNNISGFTSESNVPSQRLMEAMGFEQKGTVRMMGWGKKEGVELLGYVMPGMNGFNGEEVWSMMGSQSA